MGRKFPSGYAPKAATFAAGPMIEPVNVAPCGVAFRKEPTYVVTDPAGVDYRCVEVTANGVHVGFWAVELLGVPYG